MTEKLERIKAIPLEEILGIELDFRKMDVDEWTMHDESNRRAGKLVGKGEDYHEYPQNFLRKDEYDYLKGNEKDNINEVFSGQIVVDLGSSWNYYGYYLALHGGAKSYIAVDISERSKWELPCSISHKFEKLAEDKKEIPMGFLNHEMLSFLDASKRSGLKYSFITSGYGDYPNDESLFSSRFFDKLRNMLPECTSKNGGILQNYTDLQLDGYEIISEDKVRRHSILKKIN